MSTGHRKQLKRLPVAKAYKKVEWENKALLDFKPRYKGNNQWVHILVKWKKEGKREREKDRREKSLVWEITWAMWLRGVGGKHNLPLFKYILHIDTSFQIEGTGGRE